MSTDNPAIKSFSTILTYEQVYNYWLGCFLFVCLSLSSSYYVYRHQHLFVTLLPIFDPYHLPFLIRFCSLSSTPAHTSFRVKDDLFLTFGNNRTAKF